MHQVVQDGAIGDVASNNLTHTSPIASFSIPNLGTMSVSCSSARGSILKLEVVARAGVDGRVSRIVNINIGDEALAVGPSRDDSVFVVATGGVDGIVIEKWKGTCEYSNDSAVEAQHGQERRLLNALNQLSFSRQSVVHTGLKGHPCSVAGVGLVNDVDGVAVLMLEDKVVYSIDLSNGKREVMFEDEILESTVCMERVSDSKFGLVLLFYPSTSGARNACLVYRHSRGTRLLLRYCGVNDNKYSMREVIPVSQFNSHAFAIRNSLRVDVVED